MHSPKTTHKLRSVIQSLSKLQIIKSSFKKSPRVVYSVIALTVVIAAAGFGIKQWQKHREAKLQEQVTKTLKENAKKVRFLENKGQLANKDVRYYFEAKQGAVFVENDKIRFVAKETELRPTAAVEGKQPLFKPESVAAIKGQHSFTLNLDGANPKPNIRRGEEFGTRYNYILGANSKEWVTGVRASKELTLEDVYPGVDLRLYSTDEGSLEFDWVMDAGADFSRVKMRFDGQDSLAVNKDGSLNVGLRFTDVKFHLPESYQVTDKGKAPVNIAFNQANANTIDFAATSEIDSRYPLVVDPTLTWGTFMDGNSSDFDQYLFAIQVDPVDDVLYAAGGSNMNIVTNAAPYDANGYLNTVSGLTVPNNGTPRVAVIYRINSDGSDLMDLTLFGPSSSPGNTVGYALSLSPTGVFVGGHTSVAIPTAGTPFDSTLDGSGDGFVAQFSRDLGTLNYATYIGSTGNDFPGVTSIRALSDSSFVAGATVDAALTAAYISGSAAQSAFTGTQNMYIARFDSLNTRTWGTYVGADTTTFNDLEVFGDGRVAFAGFGTGTLTEVNSAAGRSISTADTDGILGILSNDGTTFNYLDEIGGSGNDQILDVEITGSTLYWAGSASSGFPTSGGAYDTTHNGGTDAVIGSVSTTGTNYTATFYGTSGNDLANGIKLVSKTACDGSVKSIVLAFGTVAGDSLPTTNLNGESFFQQTRPDSGTGIDMFFGGFSGDLSTLKYGTYIGGTDNDYLGDTGNPRGANHLWVSGTDIHVGTTTHSASHSPAIVGGNGFDQTKSNTAGTDDAHVIFSIETSALNELDYGDAPASFGSPSHILDCTQIRIGTLLDAETSSQPSTNADGDDVNGLDDEDGVATLPSVIIGGPQTINVQVDGVMNSTGSTANLYGWIDLNSDGKFTTNEFTSTTVADGFSGSKTLTWTGVTVSGATPKPYLRIRLTTQALADNAGTATVDERSTAIAQDGEVEDYLLPTIASTDLSITKTDGSTTYTAGNAISYTIKVSNAGPSNATGASVADMVPASITGVTVSCVASGTASCGTNASSGNNISYTGVNINSGASNFITITVSGTVSAGTTGNLVNTATVTAGAGDNDPTTGNNSATDTDTPNPVTDLAITKTDSSATYTAGNAISYTIVVTNNGPSNATGASVADNVPASITGVTASCVATGTASCGTNASSGNSVSFTGVNINAGAGNSLTITVSGTVSAGTTGNLANTASVAAGSGQTDNNSANNSATDTDTPNAITDLAITKTDGSATYTAGNAISYTITVSNNGPSNATGASVADNVPASITGVTASCVASGTASCGTNGSAGNAVSFTGVNINAGAGNFLTITVSGTVSAGATGSLTNTATVTAGAGQTDNNSANNSATDTDTPNAITDLSITKTDGSATYTPGSGISYTIVVSNAGPSNATGASIADTVPASITGVTASCVASGTANCGTNGSAGNAVSFTGVNINAGAGNFLTITVSGTVSAGATGSLTNTVTVTAGAGQTDPTSGNNSATDTDTPNAITDLSITKTDGSATYTPGNGISYTIVVSNAGPSNATGASIADSVPASITGVTASCVASGTANCGTNGSAGNAVSFTGVNINAGAGNFLTITVSGTVSAGATGSLTNTATVTAGAGQTDPTSGNNSATDTDAPNALTDLSITKTDGSATYTAGNAISYTIVVSNAGPSNATGASIADTVPASITGVTASCVASGTASCGTNGSAGNAVSFTGVNINAGAGNFLTITVSGTVSSSTTGNLSNTATVTAGAGQTDPTSGNNSATDTDTPNPLTDLSITKTDGSATYTAGNAISYTIVVANAGPSNATGASIADSVPASITGVTASCVASGTANCGTNGSAGNAVSFTGVAIPVGAGNFLTITVSGTVSAGATGNLTNTATVTAGAGQTDPTSGNNSATDTDTPNPLTDLSITKTDGSATYTAGNAISYTIVVSNAGPSNATGASVADTVPASITGVTASCVASGTANCGTNGSAGNAVSFTGVNINAGAGNFLTITVSGTVSAGATGNLTNTATVTAGAGQTDPTSGNNSATDTDTPNPLTDLSITKTDGSATYTAGNAISYTIVVSNAGPSNATGASVADSVPAAITGTTISCVASGTATCGTNASVGNSLSFTGVNINAGAGNFLTITVSGTVSAGATGNLTNTATVTAGAGQTDPTSGNNSATDTDTPNALTDLSITKTDGSATYTAGNAISYTIVVSNAGPSNATGASIADTVPAAITGVTASCVASGTANCGTNGSAGNAVSFTGVNINAGAGNFLTITVSGTVSAGATGNLTNTATVTAGAGQTDPTSGNNSATDTDTPNPQTDLSITKTDGSATYTAGNAISYSIVVRNAGPSNATAASIADTVPASITGVTASCVASGTANCGTNGSAGNNVSFTGVNINAGAGNFLTITVSGTVSSSTTGNLTNTATVTAGAGQTDPTPGNNSATDTDTPDPRADLAVTKTDGVGSYTPGTSTTYTIVVTNNGPSDVTGATVTDNKPSQVTAWTWTCAGATGGATGCDGAASSAANFSDTVNLPSGATITYTVTAVTAPDATGNMVNTVTVAVPAGTTDPTPGNNSATDTDTPNAIADLAVQKNGPATVAANGTVTYTIRVSNAGPSSANGAAVTDPFPGVLTGVTWTCGSQTGGATCAATSGSGDLNTTVAIFPPGGSVTYTVTGTAPASGTFTNTATVAPPSGVTDPNSTNNNSSVTTGVGPVPTTADLAIVKSGPSTVAPNGSMTYTIVVTNAGPGPANGATVVDTVPLSSVTWTCGNETGGASCGTASGSGNINATVTTLPAGASVTFTVTGTAPASGTLTNTATVAPPNGVTDPNNTNNTSTVSTTVQPPTATADLYAIKTGPSTVGPNSTVTYKVIVGNSGPAGVTNAPFSDNVPSVLTSVTWTCGNATNGASCGTTSGSGNNISTNVASLPASSTVTFTITGTAPASGSFVNSATITPPVGTVDPDPTDNIAGPVITNVLIVADLAITKTDGSATYTPGSPTTYTIVVTNNGPNAVTNATVADTLPAAVTSATWTCAASGGSSCGAANGSGNINTTVSLLSSGTATFTVVAQISPAATGNLINTATVTNPPGTTDPTPGNNSATDTDTPNPIADLSVTKTDGVATAVPGTATTYTIVVSNAGPSNVIGATVTDNLPAPITSWTWVCSGATGGATGCDGVSNSSSNFTDVVNLPAGSSITYTVTSNINPAATGTLVNTVSVAVPQGTTDPTSGNNTATDTDTLTPRADLAAQKNGPAMIGPNGTIVYTIRVSNAGPSSANGATVSDPLPVGLTSVSWTCGAATGGAVCGAPSGTGNVNTTVSTFPAGGSVTYTVTATGPASGSFINTATVTPPSGVTDPVTTNNSSSVTTGVGTIPNTADLAVVKSGPSSVTPGGTVTYNIVVTNAGPGAANGATFTDNPPVSSVTWTCGNATAGASCGTTSGSGNINTTIALLPAGGSVTFTVTGTAGSSGTLTNTATIAPPNGITDPNNTNNTSTVVTAVLGVGVVPAIADLYSIKTGPATVLPNATVTYTVIVGNSGPSGVTNASFTDNVPSVLTNVTWTCGSPTGGASCGTANGSGNNISTTVANLPAVSTVTFTITGTAPASGSFVNSSNITPPVGTIDNDPTDNIGGPVITNIDVQADLSITKTDGSATYTPGAPVTYTIVVTNSGRDPVTGAVVTDNKPPQVTSWAWVCSGATGGATGCDGVASNSANFTDTVNLPANSSITYTVTAQTSSAATDNLVNTANVTAPAGVVDPTLTNNSATDTDTPALVADLAVTKTDNSATYVPGLGTVYTIVVSNPGPSNVIGALVTDSIPAQTTSWTWVCSGATGGATGCDGVSNSISNFNDTVNLPAGSSITYTVTAQTSPNTSGNMVNTVTVAPPQGVTDPVPSNNNATDADTPAPRADLSLTKAVNNSQPGVGQPVVFTITVRNAGPSTATGVSVGDVLPQGLTFVSANPSVGSYNPNNGIWTVGTLAPNATATLQMTVTVLDDSAANIAEVITSDVPDPDSTPGNGVPGEDDIARVEFTTNKGPGRPISPRSEAADNKAGSVLIYNYYTSSATSSNIENTRFNITNVSPSMDVRVHLFFVDGTTCSVADNYLCLTANQTSSFLAADLDPGISGYLVAIAVDQDGCPINANCLVGDEYVKISSGQAGNVGAVSISAIASKPVACDNTSIIGTLKFDGISYNRLPRVLSLDNMPSRSDGNDTLVVINRIGGNLGIGASTLGTLFGILYNDTENAYSFSVTGSCQIRSSLSNNFPRTTPRFEQAVPAGTTGWLKLWSAADGAILGSSFNFNPNKGVSVSAYGGSHNLHHLNLSDAASYVIPIFPPSC